ncbi:MAG: DEAD/DEAH box helicase [Candidatus Hodarchaeales archaeon]
MVDFKKLVSKKQKVDLTDLLTLFESLDRKTSHIELRSVQEEALKVLSKRRMERDIILKISTGAGKTSVGLLYLWSLMEEKQQPVVYLCPTKQLREQVYKEAEKLGLNSVIYPAGEPFPNVDGIAAKAIIICTYDKLFNAKTTFNRTDVMLRPCAIVLDDAHAGVEEIRDCFKMYIANSEFHKDLLKIFNDPCSHFNAALWQDIMNNDPNCFMEVPFWIWKSVLPEIEKSISKYSDDRELQFTIPHIRDVLRWCRCVISGEGIEIIPDILPVHKSEAFNQAPHRLFMSATLADDSVLVRELGCNISAAEKPVIPENDRGLGERMVLAPSLIDASLNREWVMSLCEKLSKKLNVVVLSPSGQKAEDWRESGAHVFLGDEVQEAVKLLNSPTDSSNFAVFVQRYDGIDLPDNSCRVLVLDGMPLGEGLQDRYDSSTSGLAGGTRNRLIYRIEQGMGRAVRSHADYAVILLAGNELAHFIAKHDVLSAMNPDTQAQLRLAIDLSKMASEDTETDPERAVTDMILKCLKRDDGWKQFYNETVRNDDKKSSSTTDVNRLALANAERSAFDSILVNDPQNAIKILRSAIDGHVSNESIKGWYLQRIANYLYDIDTGEALEAQRAAYENNKSMIRPPGTIKRPQIIGTLDSQAVTLKWYQQFSNPNGAIASIQDLRTKLSFDLSHEIVEQAFCDLAPLLGANGSRPEKELDDGPDVLWLWSDISLVIEAKTQNEKSLHKKDAGQLAVSLEWFKKDYSTRNDPIPIVLAKMSACDHDAHYPSETRIIIPDKLYELLDTLEQFFLKVINQPLLSSNPKSLKSLQQEFSLLPEQFINKFTVEPIKKKTK